MFSRGGGDVKLMNFYSQTTVQAGHQESRRDTPNAQSTQRTSKRNQGRIGETEAPTKESVAIARTIRVIAVFVFCVLYLQSCHQV